MSGDDRSTTSARGVWATLCLVVATMSVPLLLVGAGRTVFFEPTASARAEAESGAGLVTMGVGMLALGSAGWWAARRAARDERTSRAVPVLGVLSVLWPLWILFVHWYDGR